MYRIVTISLFILNLLLLLHTMEKFKNLGLSEESLMTLKKQGIVEPTEIQEKAIPFALEGRDVVAASATGSGKTLVFASAIIEKIIPNGHIQSIVLTPTRELAEQVSDSIRNLAGKRLNVLSIYGGVPIDAQMRKLKNADVVVGTPGRILDHLNRRSLRLSEIKILVLDEFDRMLDMGFHKDVDKIIQEIPTKRQTLLFSATTSGVAHLIEKYTKNFAEITAETYVDHSKLKQIYYDTPSNVKFSLLVQLLEEEKQNPGLIIVFCSTRRNVEFVTENLKLNRIKAEAIHGGMEQKKRIRVLKEFQGKGPGVLVCTDVAARGLDIKGVSHVYNYDLPQVVDDYIHRIGRTARAGENGIAVNILGSRDYEIFSDIINQKKVTIKEIPLPYVKRALMDKEAGQRTNGRRDSGRGRDSSRGRTSNGRQNNSGRGNSRNQNQNQIQLHDAVCMKCKRPCKVPFKPTTGKGVSCSDCFVRTDSKGNNGRRNDQRRSSPSSNGRRMNDSNSNGRRNDQRRSSPSSNGRRNDSSSNGRRSSSRPKRY
jgi:ATP-dependent RNA helicase DeaD